MTTTPTPRVWTLVRSTLERHRLEAEANVRHLRTVAATYLVDLDLSDLTVEQRAKISAGHDERRDEAHRSLSSAERLVSELSDAGHYFDEAERLALDTPAPAEPVVETRRFSCPCGYTTTDSLTLDVIAEQTEECPSCSLPGSVSTLPANWRRLPTSTLEGFAENSGQEPFLTDADYDDVLDELSARDESLRDARVAQGTGNARGELPS